MSYRSYYQYKRLRRQDAQRALLSMAVLGVIAILIWSVPLFKVWFYQLLDLLKSGLFYASVIPIYLAIGFKILITILKPVLLYGSILAFIFSAGYLLYVYLKRDDMTVNEGGYRHYTFAGFQHRLIARRHLNRKLVRGEEVHHINGKRYDNRPENLCVMYYLDHRKFHNWLRHERKRLGYYPSIQFQRSILEDRFRGILCDKMGK